MIPSNYRKLRSNEKICRGDRAIYSGDAMSKHAIPKHEHGFTVAGSGYGGVARRKKKKP